MWIFVLCGKRLLFHIHESSCQVYPSTAVRVGSYDMVLALILGGAFVEQVCLKKWTATHEAAKVGCADILMLLLRHSGKVTARDGHGVTPLGIAAEHGHANILEILIENGKIKQKCLEQSVS